MLLTGEPKLVQKSSKSMDVIMEKIIWGRRKTN
jgi:hypothetical protein